MLYDTSNNIQCICLEHSTDDFFAKRCFTDEKDLEHFKI